MRDIQAKFKYNLIEAIEKEISVGGRHIIHIEKDYVLSAALWVLFKDVYQDAPNHNARDRF